MIRITGFDCLALEVPGGSLLLIFPATIATLQHPFLKKEKLIIYNFPS